MSAHPNPDAPPCESCGRPGAVQHFPGAVPVSGIWCAGHLARLRWLHPLGDRGRFLWMALAALAFAGVAALRLEAQDCRGVPSRFVHVMASRLELNDGTPSYTGELGLHAGRGYGMNLNYNTSDIGNPGSVTRSAGFRLYRQGRYRWLSFCALTGYQVGQIYLIDVDATSLNYRETSTTIPVALPISARLRLAPGVGVTAWVSPQYLLQNSRGQLYDRGDTLRVDESPSASAMEVGASLALTRIFVRLSWFKRSDRDGDITLAGGFAW